MENIPLFPECASCILTMVEKTLKASKIPREKALRITQEILHDLAEGFLPPCSAVELANTIFTRIVTLTGNPDPFSVEKRESNALVKELLPQIRKRQAQIPSLEERFNLAMRLALLGNTIDVGTSGHSYSWEEIIDQVRNASQIKVTIDDSRNIYEKYVPFAKILYLGDNAGEIGFDLVFIEELQHKNAKVTLVVKGSPVSNDATMADVQAFGGENIANEVITTGVGKLGAPLDQVSELFLQKLHQADLIIAKGQSNYETLLPYVNQQKHKPVWCLLKAKCQFIADSLRTSLGTYVAKLYV